MMVCAICDRYNVEEACKLYVYWFNRCLLLEHKIKALQDRLNAPTKEMQEMQAVV